MTSPPVCELDERTPTLTDLVANADIADILGVTRSAVSNWYMRDERFPEPVVRVSNGAVPLWLWPQVEAWAMLTGRMATPNTH